MLFTKKHKQRLADAENELKEVKKELKELKEVVSKKYIHEQEKEEEKYSVSQIVDEWLNGESNKGDD